MMASLLDARADINAWCETESYSQITPLNYALEHQLDGMVRLLITRRSSRQLRLLHSLTPTPSPYTRCACC